MRNLCYLILLLLLLVRCIYNNNLNFENKILKDKKIAYETDSLVINIDSLSLPYNNCIQYYSDSVKKYFTYLNTHTHSIYFIDYKTKKIDFIWKVLNGNQLFDAYYIVNQDSMWLYNTDERILRLYNSKGNFLDSFNLNYPMIKESTLFPFPYLNSNLPLINHRNNLYLIGYHLGEFGSNDHLISSRKTIINFNTNNNNITFHLNYPRYYYLYNWGFTYFYMTSATFNPFKKIIVVNYPASHELYTYNIENEKEEAVFAGSCFIKSINPYTKNKNKFVDSRERLLFFLNNASYSSVHYDKFKNVYYRIAAIPTTAKFDISKKDFWEKRKFTIICMNGKFEYLGEILIDKIIPDNIFISEEGIHLQTFSNDNIMKFKIIDLKNSINE